ncbi:MAG: RidA family protein [Myxococcota bacterium]
MTKHSIATDSAPAALGPYSQALQVTGATQMLFCSGQIPLDPVTGNLEDEPAEATKVCMNNLRVVLAAGGMSLQDVVKTTIYLRDMADFAAVNEAYGSFFEGPPPARATVQVSALPKNARVEIDAIAVR